MPRDKKHSSDSYVAESYWVIPPLQPHHHASRPCAILELTAPPPIPTIHKQATTEHWFPNNLYIWVVFFDFISAASTAFFAWCRPWRSTRQNDENSEPISRNHLCIIYRVRSIASIYIHISICTVCRTFICVEPGGEKEKSQSFQMYIILFFPSPFLGSKYPIMCQYYYIEE